MLLVRSHHKHVRKEGPLAVQKDHVRRLCRRVEGGIAEEEGARTEIHPEIAVL